SEASGDHHSLVNSARVLGSEMSVDSDLSVGSFQGERPWWESGRRDEENDLTKETLSTQDNDSKISPPDSWISSTLVLLTITRKIIRRSEERTLQQSHITQGGRDEPFKESSRQHTPRVYEDRWCCDDLGERPPNRCGTKQWTDSRSDKGTRPCGGDHVRE